MAPRSRGSAIGLSRRYSAALQKHLAPKPGTSLRPAESLGREALAAGLDRLDLVRIHEEAWITLRPPRPSVRNSDGMPKRARSFLVAALTPIENAHRTALEKSGHLNRLNGTMRRQTAELAAAKRRLQREVVRRNTLQAALENSEQHYGQLLKRSRRMQEHLRRLSHEILFAQEQERKRISRDLHDQIAQTLTAVNIKLAALKKEATVTTRGLKRTISITQRLVERSMHTVHRFARELRPHLLDDLGVIPALEAHMKAFTKQTRIPIRFTASPAVERLDMDRRTVFYRVAQEAFTNIAKHARASLVDVSIQKVKGLVRMEIHDNGRSFDANRVLSSTTIVRLGLLGMRERVEMVGGNFEVESEAGKGTTIRAQIPFRGRE
jgi:signal transduction histidine kinase